MHQHQYPIVSSLSRARFDIDYWYLYFVDITIATGLLNGAIFFSNLVTLYGSFLFHNLEGTLNYESRLGIFIPYILFFSLNFGHEECLYDGMKVFGRLLCHLSFSIYHFILILVIILLARCCKIPKVAPYFQGLSIIRTITTLLVHCYVSILQITAELYSFVQISTIDGDTKTIWKLQPSSNYFKDAHILLLLLAIFLSLCLLLFSFFLLIPYLVYKIKRLSKLKPIYDSFLASFQIQVSVMVGISTDISLDTLCFGHGCASPN